MARKGRSTEEIISALQEAEVRIGQGEAVGKICRSLGISESFNSKLRDESLAGEQFSTLHEAQVLIERWRRHYNAVRPHSSLGYRPPAPEAILPSESNLAYASLRPDQMLADRGPTLT